MINFDARIRPMPSAGRLIALALLLVACGGTPPPTDRVPEPARAGFTHAAHLADTPAMRQGNGGAALACGDCHAVTAATAWTVQRPGAGSHAPCDGCHEDAFYAAPGPLCTACHTGAPDPRAPIADSLPDYPRRQPFSELIGAFNHRLHLQSPALAAAKLTCTGCHTVEAGSPYASIPNHAVCATCHAPEQTRLAAAAAPPMAECGACHAPGVGPGRARRFLKNDIGFTHAKHQQNPDGTAIACETCHYAIAKSESSRSADVQLPLMLDCRRCHDDARRTPPEVGMDRCKACHQSGSIDPANPPANHTASRVAPGATMTAWRTPGWGEP